MATFRTLRQVVLPGPGTQIVPGGVLVGDGTPYPLSKEVQDSIADKIKRKATTTFEAAETPKPPKAEPAEKADPGPAVIDPSKEYKPGGEAKAESPKALVASKPSAEGGK